MYCIAKVSIQPIYRDTIQSPSYYYNKPYILTWSDLSTYSDSI